MQHKPLFSVIIPVYNRPVYIADAIRSVIAQKFSDWELLVVDDGSTDSTQEVILSFTDIRIRYIHQQNAERGAARNTGVRNALGEYLLFMDSDDLMLPDHMIQANLVLKKNPGILLFHLNFRTQGPGGSKVTIFPSKLNNVLITGNPFGCIGIVVQKEIVMKFPFCEDRLLAGTEDYELWLRLAARFPLLHFPVVTSVLRDHSYRSVAQQVPEELEKRILFFIKLVRADSEVMAFLKKDYSSFLSRRYSYIALHSAMAGYKVLAARYLIKSVSALPRQLLTTRSLQILRFLIKR
jgi:glycosyltransferase involved in cell wall biosynthesis